MRYRSRGFTLVEVLVVIVVGAILTSIAIKGFGSTSSRAAVREARNVFAGLVARTRAQAIESGQNTLLIADAAGDSVLVFGGGGVIENVRFGEELGVDIRASSAITRVCMSPRGYANPACTSFSSTVKLAFVQGGQADTVEILPMGQVRW